MEGGKGGGGAQVSWPRMSQQFVLSKVHPLNDILRGKEGAVGEGERMGVE